MVDILTVFPMFNWLQKSRFVRELKIRLRLELELELEIV